MDPHFAYGNFQLCMFYTCGPVFSRCWDLWKTGSTQIAKWGCFSSSNITKEMELIKGENTTKTDLRQKRWFDAYCSSRESSSRVPGALFQPPWVPMHTWHTPTQTHKHAKGETLIWNGEGRCLNNVFTLNWVGLFLISVPWISSLQ